MSELRKWFEEEEKLCIPIRYWRELLMDKHDVKETINYRITRDELIPWGYNLEESVNMMIDRARGSSIKDDIAPGVIKVHNVFIASVQTPFGWLRRPFDNKPEALLWRLMVERKFNEYCY